ncbi:MAG: UDP-N-acetylmuramoyl-L-alanyl-D-glutamate--2,6-diaminopimelate ligase [Actinomycetaceae bacterium]|nr:UDP-N-acetylmuramoyl-L-alanyl-D-glutamate--2,6-diaminopimelate ligase [Actinomycetaceae bacterium]
MTELSDLRPQYRPQVDPADLVAAVGGNLRPGLRELDEKISGVTLDSKDVQSGDLFVAVPGFKRHGAEFAAAAVEAGAVAVATDARGLEVIGDQFPNIYLIEVEDPRAWAGLAAAHVWANPGDELTMVGITGTNGKTTTTHFVHHALTQLSGPTMMIGTVGVTLGDTHVESARTSVEAPLLHRILKWARERGAKNVVMEVSSHALSLNRVEGVTFDMVAFLNLQRDHLDFHKTMREYFDAKALLFEPGLARRGVVCIDDEWGRQLSQQAPIPIEVVTTSGRLALENENNNAHAGWYVAASELNETDAGTDLKVGAPSGEVDMHCPLPGVINVQNQMTALAVVTGLGYAPQKVADALSTTAQVPGRMEVIAKRDDDTPLVIVDFAHTPDAMSSACNALDPVTPGRLWCLFGATGDRDRGKRPLMAKAAAANADIVILTDDDIYTEDPAAIRAEVATGFGEANMRARQLWEDDDRANAIRAAVLAASADDTILIAGRGHETIQMIGDTPHPLDDRAEAREAVAMRADARKIDVTVWDSPQGQAPRLRNRAQTWEDLDYHDTTTSR